MVGVRHALLASASATTTSAPASASGPIEVALTTAADAVALASRRFGIDPLAIEQQLRLHLPSCSEQSVVLSPDSTVADVLYRLGPRFDQIRRALARQRELNGLQEYPAGTSGRSAIGFLALGAGEVAADIGEFVQDKLHYLHAPRADTLLHFGAFTPSGEFPVGYLAVAPCDRDYIIDALSQWLGSAVKRDRVLVVSRSWTAPRSPHGLVSWLYARARATLRAREVDFLVTALNPMLGFDGSSLRASGFVPFATSAVAYGYDANGLYVTRRSRRVVRQAQFGTPPNVLYVSPVHKKARAHLRLGASPVPVDSDMYAQAGAER